MAENENQNTQGWMFDVKLNKTAEFDECYLQVHHDKWPSSRMCSQTFV